MVKNEFFLNNSKNIDIWILRKEQNLFRSEFYKCVPSLVKIDWVNAHQKSKMAATKLFFCHFNIRPRWFPEHHRDRFVINNLNLSNIRSYEDEIYLSRSTLGDYFHNLFELILSANQTRKCIDVLQQYAS